MPSQSVSGRAAPLSVVLISLALTALVILTVVYAAPVIYAILGVAAVILAFLVRWHASHTGYHCPKCGHEFTAGVWVDLASPHTLESKYLICPGCNHPAWCRMIDQRDITS